MKKTSTIILAATLAATVFLGGCSDSDSKTKTPNSPTSKFTGGGAPSGVVIPSGPTDVPSSTVPSTSQSGKPSAPVSIATPTPVTSHAPYTGKPTPLPTYSTPYVPTPLPTTR